MNYTDAYTHQINEGCGSISCTCPFCASCPEFKLEIENRSTDDILKTVKNTSAENICPNICPVLYKPELQKLSDDFKIMIKSMGAKSKIETIKPFIDSKEKFCSLFWGTGDFSKKNYNFDCNFICHFADFAKLIRTINVLKEQEILAEQQLTETVNSRPQNNSKDNNEVQKKEESTTKHQSHHSDINQLNEIFLIISDRVNEICSSDYSYFNLRGLYVFYAFCPLFDIDQFIKLFSQIIEYIDKGPITLIHDIYFVVSKYPKFIEKLVDYSQSILTYLSQNYIQENSLLIRAIVKHISFLCQANEISPKPIPYDKFQNEAFTQLLDPQREVVKMIRGEFSYISKSYLLTLPFKRAIGECESQILMYLNEDEENDSFKLEIGRDTIYEDTIEQLKNARPDQLLKLMTVTFKGEDAADQGGVSKEYFSLASNLLFDDKHFDKTEHFHFFKENYDFLEKMKDSSNSDSSVDSSSENSDDEANSQKENETDANANEEDPEKQYYEICGKFAGLAVHNGIVLPIRFPLFFYRLLRKVIIRLDDIEEIKPEVARSLKSILLMRKDGTDEDFDALDMNFTITYVDSKTKTITTIPIIENGENIKVTKNNAQLYVHTMKKCIIKSYKDAFKAFKKGFWQAIGSKTYSLFFAEELDKLVSGNYNYDWDALRENTMYESGYSPKSETIQMFWDIFNELTEDQKKEFLFFVTGSKIVPIDGLAGIHLEIHRSSDTKLLPVSHTCFNILQLPDYKNKEELRKNIMICICNNKGFGVL